MDLATLIGIVAGFALILGAMSTGGSLTAFANGPGLLIVVGGTLSATLIHDRMRQVFRAVSVARNAFRERHFSPEGLIERIVSLAAKARKEGLVSLEGETIEDPFLARGVRLGVDGLSPEVIRSTLGSELRALKKRHQRGQRIFRFMGSTAPAMGMVGTLIGLVQMLRKLEDPDAIGPAMAVALLTTMYGSILAFLVFNPIAQKLEARSQEEVEQKTLAIVGVESILKGDNTLVIQSKLESFLTPEERRQREEKQKASK